MAALPHWTMPWWRICLFLRIRPCTAQDKTAFTEAMEQQLCTNERATKEAAERTYDAPTKLDRADPTERQQQPSKRISVQVSCLDCSWYTDGRYKPYATRPAEP